MLPSRGAEVLLVGLVVEKCTYFPSMPCKMYRMSRNNSCSVMRDLSVNTQIEAAIKKYTRAEAHSALYDKLSVCLAWIQHRVWPEP